MTDKPTQEFQREERYIVVKRKQLDEETEAELRRFLQIQSIPTVECVIVESDWPEYETVWKMIEDRVTGNTRSGDATELLRNCKLMIRSLLHGVQASDHLVRLEPVDGKTRWLRSSVVLARIDAHLEGEA